jgi:hypothetical protein
VESLETDFLPVPPAPAFGESLTRFLLPAAAEAERMRRMRRATMTLLQTPEYQLC